MRLIIIALAFIGLCVYVNVLAPPPEWGSESLTDYQHIRRMTLLYSGTEHGIMAWEPDPWLDTVGVDPDTVLTDEHLRLFLDILKERLQQLEVEANVRAGRCL